MLISECPLIENKQKLGDPSLSQNTSDILLSCWLSFGVNKYGKVAHSRASVYCNTVAVEHTHTLATALQLKQYHFFVKSS